MRDKYRTKRLIVAIAKGELKQTAWAPSEQMQMHKVRILADHPAVFPVGNRNDIMVAGSVPLGEIPGVNRIDTLFPKPVR